MNFPFFIKPISKLHCYCSFIMSSEHVCPWCTSVETSTEIKKSVEPEPPVLPLPETKKSNAKLEQEAVINLGILPTYTVKHSFGKSYKYSTPYTDRFYSGQNINIMDFDLETLRGLMDNIISEKNGTMRSFGMFYYFGENKFDIAINLISEQITKLLNPAFNTPIVMSKTEIVNGYSLYDCKINLATYDYFCELVKLMRSERKWTFDEWKKEMSDTCCTDWYKKTDGGESIGNGFWSYPEDSYQYKNAWQLTFNRSCKKMWKLPFSKDLLLETIRLGCSNRRESVRYSNFVCVWVQRKLETVKID